MLNQSVGVIYWLHLQILWYCPSKNRALTLNQPLLALRSALFVPQLHARAHIYCLHRFHPLEIQLLPSHWGPLMKPLHSPLLLDYFISNPDKIPSRAERCSSRPGSSVTALQATVNLLNMKFINCSFSCLQHNSSLTATRTFATLGTSKWNPCLAWFSIILFQSQTGGWRGGSTEKLFCLSKQNGKPEKTKQKIFFLRLDFDFHSTIMSADLCLRIWLNLTCQVRESN